MRCAPRVAVLAHGVRDVAEPLRRGGGSGTIPECGLSFADVPERWAGGVHQTDTHEILRYHQLAGGFNAGISGRTRQLGSGERIRSGIWLAEQNPHGRAAALMMRPQPGIARWNEWGNAVEQCQCQSRTRRPRTHGPETDRRLDLRAGVAHRTRRCDGAIEPLFGVEEKSLCTKGGAHADQGVDRERVGTGSIWIDQGAVASLGLGVVVCESSDGGQPERRRAVGGISREPTSPACADRLDTISGNRCHDSLGDAARRVTGTPADLKSGPENRERIQHLGLA